MENTKCFQLFISLDKEEKTSQKHLDGIAAVNEILKEMKVLETEHENLFNKIKEK